MANEYPTPNESTLLSQADGRALAVEMLIAFRESNSDECSIQNRYRPGAPQSDILTHYLQIVSDQQNHSIKAGFNAVLTDFLSHTMSCGLIEPEFYEALDDADIERAPTAEECGE